ncbi:Protein flp-like protein [Cladobotryum mycophilum]|uniref:Protein flp-like protein n=1 Tax=Cladobotryum mycophilum TaxID=491253 RepID=A0ABR0SG60_9HYPO
MNLKMCFNLLASWTIGKSSSGADEEEFTPLQRLDQVHPLIDKICNSSGVAGASIGVIHKGNLIDTYNFGYRDVEKQLPTTSDTVYGIGSVTKSFVAAGIAKLVEQGKLSWNMTVRQILPGFDQENPSIADTLTIADILSHRSGLNGFGDMNLAFQGDGDMLLPRDSLFPLVKHFKQLFPIRSNWSYFVWGYALAGKIIETVTNQTLSSFIDQELLKPLHLNATTFDPDCIDPDKFAEPYAGLENGTAYHLKKRQVFKDTFFEASGGMYSNLNDILAWSGAMLNAINGKTENEDSVIKQVREIVSNHAAIENPSLRERSYGYGWVRTELPGPVGLIGDNAGLWDIKESPVLGSPDQPLLMIYHQGSTVGYYTFVALFPDSDSAVVVLTNSIAVSDAADWIARVIIKALLNLKDKNNYVKLAKKGNKRAVGNYKEMNQRIAKLRLRHCLKRRSHDLSSFVGTYNSRTKPFHIEIIRPDDTTSELEFRFQGLKDQTYKLRHLCRNEFEWVLTHDEAKMRGRYGNTDYRAYVFKFEEDDNKKIVSFSWETDPGGPGVKEVFVKSNGNAMTERLSHDQVTLTI